MNNSKSTQIGVDVLLQRIDTMMRELQEMRRMVLTQNQTADENLVEQLCGSFSPTTKTGKFDSYLDWERSGQ